MEAINPLTVRDAVKSSSPAIGFLYQDSKIKAAAIISLMIVDLVKFFNVGKTMDKFQVGQTITLILEDENYRCLKPDDFKLCFNRIKKGEYGKAYDRMDGQIILECLNKYLHERVQVCEEISYHEHKVHKEEKMAPINPEGQKKVLEILKGAIKHVPQVTKKEVEQEKVEFKKPSYNVRERYIQFCFRKFYKIWSKNPAESETPGKYIHYKGKPVTETEYTSLRLKRFDSLISKGKELELK